MNKKEPSKLAQKIAGYIINTPRENPSRHARIEDVAHELSLIIDQSLDDQDAFDREQARIATYQQKRILAYRSVLSGLLRSYGSAEEIEDWSAAIAHAESFLKTESQEDADFFSK